MDLLFSPTAGAWFGAGRFSKCVASGSINRVLPPSIMNCRVLPGNQEAYADLGMCPETPFQRPWSGMRSSFCELLEGFLTTGPDKNRTFRGLEKYPEDGLEHTG